MFRQTHLSSCAILQSQIKWILSCAAAITVFDVKLWQPQTTSTPGRGKRSEPNTVKIQKSEAVENVEHLWV